MHISPRRKLPAFHRGEILVKWENLSHNTEGTLQKRQRLCRLLRATTFMKNPFARILAAPLLLSFACSLCYADEQQPQPKWELGAGGAVFTLPNYRGSDIMRTYVLPVPYVVYRGDFVKADRDGVRSTLFDTESFKINLSVNGTLPVNSKDDPNRRGMADLRPSVEIGPTADLTLWRSSDTKLKLDFRMPLRTAITLETSPKQIGWVLSPSLNLDIHDPAGLKGWNLGLMSSVLIQDHRYNDYFYSVGAADATPTRPVYSAPGGYAGSQFTLALSKRFPHWWIGSFLRYDTVSNARFEDSPLVKKRNTVSAGVAVAYVFGESPKKVAAPN